MLSRKEEALLAEAKERELVDLIAALVRIDSVYRPESGRTESEVVAFVRDWVRREIGVEPVIDEVVPGRENVVLTIDSGKPGPTLLLEGHTDVVSEGDPSSWTKPPFSGAVEGRRLYGRGSCDMKAGVAINLLVARAFARRRADFSGKLKLCLVCDEEGMMIGIKDFIRRGHADGVDACLVSEPEDNELCISMKGAIRASVKVTGKMAHGAMPLFGINPNIRMARIILAVEAYERAEKERLGEDELLGWPSLTFTTVQSPPAGETAQFNVMPRDSLGYIDIRTVARQDHEKIKDDLRRILAELAAADPDFKAELDFFEERPCVSMGRDEPIVAISAEAYTDVSGRAPVYDGVPGATDGTFLRALKGIPCLVNGPGPRKIPHHVDEYVDLDMAWEAYRWYLVTALRYLNGARAATGGAR
jgi:succinyl-diaminopimelate desuccinylase